MTVALPHNIEAEQALLGAVLINNDAYGMVAGLIRPDHFFEPAHAEIFRVIGTAVTAGKKATPVTLRSVLPEIDIAGLKTSQYVARLCAEAITVINAPDYARLIRDLATIRQIIAVGDGLRGAQDSLSSPDEAIRYAWEALDDLRVGLVEGGRTRGSIAALVERIRKDRQDGGEVVSVYSTGFTDLDKVMTGGWRARRLYVFAARPGMGKTTLLLSSARRVARHGAGVSIFSLEIDQDEVRSRITADELARTNFPIQYSKILAQSYEPHEFAALETAEAEIATLPIEIDAQGALGMADIEARARMDRERFAKRGIALGLVGIDYLGLIKATSRRNSSKVDDFGEIALAAKNMAKRLDVPVVLLAQLNRAVETREDKRPTMADLRASGEIEEHADVVGLMVRPAVYVLKSEGYRNNDPAAFERFEREKFHMELILGKNRLGPANDVDLWCDVAHGAVDNWRVV